MDEDELLALFGDGHEEAEKQYLQLFGAFRRFFEWRGCGDPEDLAQMVFERGIEKLRAGGQIWDVGIGGFLFGFAKKILQEDRKRRREVPFDSASVVEISRIGDAEKALLIKEYLNHLTIDERRALVDYVNGKRGGADGESSEALRIRIFRIRRKLNALHADTGKEKKSASPVTNRRVVP